MGLGLDRYSAQAEALPVFLALCPGAALLVALLPEGLSPEALLARLIPIVGLIGLSLVASQIGADSGKRREPSLWEQWDGPPATRFLRHTNREYNIVSRQRVHDKLRDLGLDVPTREEELRDAACADTCYSACVAELRRLTRDSTRFPLVHKRLIDYGFRRNALGLKRFSLVLSPLVLLACVPASILAYSSEGVPYALLGVCVVAAIHLLSWAVLVNEGAVSRSADRYADALLEAAMNVE